MDHKYAKYKEELEKLRQQGNLRQMSNFSDQNFKLNLSSNDYLGIACNQKHLNAFYQDYDATPDAFRCGSGSSRLLTGNFPLYEQLEDEMAVQYGRPVLFFNSGYHANIGLLPALTGKRDLILSDKLNHASIIDGIRLSEADFVRYRHLDYEHLEKLLIQKRECYERVFIVSESIFSMDGDEVDLKTLVELKNRYDCFLYLDEAHALGVRGPKGLGLAEEQSFMDEIDLLVGTFGKAMASQGAFVVCPEPLKDYLVNRMRSLIFTTALPPVIINWNLKIFKAVLRMNKEREELIHLSNRLRDQLLENGIRTGGSSNILPIMVGDNEKCIILAEHLRKLGFLVFPIRPPTVPPGQARLRLSLCAGMQWEELKDLPKIIKELMQ